MDLLNLLMLDEPYVGGDAREALLYLQNNMEALTQKKIDGISKIEILHYFLREYKALK